MDFQLNLTLAILAAALILFVLDVLPADLVALLVVVALGLTCILTPQEAFSGFSRAAVITIMSIFILAAALERTGVVEQVGRHNHNVDLHPGVRVGKDRRSRTGW